MHGYLFRKFVYFIIIFFIFSLSGDSSNKHFPPQSNKFSIETGENLLKKGDFHQAIGLFKQELKFAKEIDDEYIQVKCYMRLGLLYWNIGQLEKSSEFYIKAKSLAKKLSLQNELEKCRCALEIYRSYLDGKEYRSIRKYQQSIESFQSAIELARQTGSLEHELKCLRHLSITYLRINNLQEFRLLNEKALQIAKSLNHKTAEGRCLNNLGSYYKKFGNYSKAIDYYEKALETQDEKNQDMADCLNNIGTIYKRLGNYDKALGFLMEALEIDKQSGDDKAVSMALNNIGITFRLKSLLNSNKEDTYRALSYYFDSLKLAEKNQYTEIEIKVLNNIGSIYSSSGNDYEAIKCFDSAYEKAEQIRYIEAMGMIFNNMGTVYMSLSMIKKAEESFNRAIKLALEIRGSEILWEAYFGLGKCYERKHEFSQAAMCYKKSIDIVDCMRSQIVIDSYKVGFARNKLKVYESLIGLLYKMNINNASSIYIKEIFHIVERAKARAFLEILEESRINIRKGLSPHLMKRESEASAHISLINQEISNANISKEKRIKLLKDLQHAESDYTALIARMRIEIPGVANIVFPEPCHLDQVQRQLLNSNTALIEYFLGEKQSFIFIITKDKYNLFSLPPQEEIRRSLKAYLKIISNPPKERFYGGLAAKRLCKELLLFHKNVIPDTIENLIIIPDGILYYLPFESLILPTYIQSLEDEFLISRYKISYMPSSSSLLFLSKKKKAVSHSKDLLAFGNPSYAKKTAKKKKVTEKHSEILKEFYQNQGFNFSALPYSEKEIKKISRFISQNKRDVYLRDDAKEDVIKKIPLKDYNIIHFACHGFLNEKFPSRSALLLSLDNDVKEDGFLQVREIYNLRMTADLVVLSACHTGKGKLEKGEGVLGLPRIFFYSGVRSVVSTLWIIEDKSSAKFMSNFYYYLSQGMDKAQSLRLAKLKMINSKLSHPFYWAAFILNGESYSKLNFN